MVISIYCKYQTIIQYEKQPGETKDNLTQDVVVLLSETILDRFQIDSFVKIFHCDKVRDSTRAEVAITAFYKIKCHILIGIGNVDGFSTQFKVWTEQRKT